jgi:hypothetical protein
LKSIIKFAASLEGRATLTADINFVQKVASSLNAFGTLTGDINFVQKVQAFLLTSASVTGNIIIPKLVQASLTGAGTTAANLTVGGAFDADAQAFFNRVTTAGGTLTTTEQNAVNTLVIQMKADGIWTKMKAIYPMVGASAAACAQNLKSASFTGTFSSGWTFANTGVTPNGTSAFMNSGLNTSSNLPSTNNHISFYSRTSSIIATTVEMGVFSNLPTNIFLHLRAAINYVSGGITAILNFTTTTTALGFWLGSKLSNTSRKTYYNGSLQGTNTTLDSNALPNLNVFISARNDNGVAGVFSDKQCAFATIGDGLTDAEAANFYTAVQAFQTSLNRQV